jgi:Na+/proline symporter
VFGFAVIVLAYAYLSASAGLSIFEMVENAYLVTLCGAFVPLAAGVYWKKATNTGALMSIAFGVVTWSALEVLNIRMMANGEELMVPPQLAGVLMAVLGMVIGSNIHKHRHPKTA